MRAGVALADTRGADAVTMRDLAATLHSGTTSLYRCLSNREELLDLMVDQVLGEAETPLSGDWRADLEAIARQLRAILLSHPWLSSELAGRPALGPHGLAHHELALTATLPLTSDPTEASEVIATVLAYVRGAATGEIAEIQARHRSGLTERQWQVSVGPYLRRQLATGAYPQLSRVISEADDLHHDERFEFGLACVLDGIAARLRTHPERSEPAT